MLRANNGKPASHGLYVAYVDDDAQATFATRMFLVWDGKWSYPLSDMNYRGTVYGWIGPLEPMKFAVETDADLST